jgi:hypothetical protein
MDEKSDFFNNSMLSEPLSKKEFLTLRIFEKIAIREYTGSRYSLEILIKGNRNNTTI